MAVMIGMGGGCATTAPQEPEPIAVVREDTINASFDAVWESTRDSLLNLGIGIYTRDKRGFFVAYGPQRRKLLTPRRNQYTIILEQIDATRTRIELETMPQRYAISLLTHPKWQEDPKAPLPDRGDEILATIKVNAASTDSSN
jgi:hypothetical protein